MAKELKKKYLGNTWENYPLWLNTAVLIRGVTILQILSSVQTSIFYFLNATGLWALSCLSFSTITTEVLTGGRDHVYILTVIPASVPWYWYGIGMGSHWKLNWI